MKTLTRNWRDHKRDRQTQTHGNWIEIFRLAWSSSVTHIYKSQKRISEVHWLNVSLDTYICKMKSSQPSLEPMWNSGLVAVHVSMGCDQENFTQLVVPSFTSVVGQAKNFACMLLLMYMELWGATKKALNLCGNDTSPCLSPYPIADCGL